MSPKMVVALDILSTSDVSIKIANASTEFSIIAVQSYGGAGSMFLHSLLDNHPDILVLPATLGIQFYASWSIRIPHTPAHEIGYVSMKALIMDFFAMVYDQSTGAPYGLTELGKGMDESAVVDKSEFSRIFDLLFLRLASEGGLAPAHEVCSANIHSYRTICFKAVHIAYAFLLGQDISRKKFLLYPAHGGPMLDIGALCEDFSDVRFVHMVREPIGNLDSVQRRLIEIEKSTDPTLDAFWCVVNQIYFDRAPHAPVCGVPMYAIYPYPTALPGRSVAVQLEKLHGEPRRTLAALCTWLGLEWSDSLLESTFAGKTWWNLPGLRRVTGFNTAMTSRPVQFGKFDQWRLRWLAAPIGVKLGYPGYGRNRLREWLALSMSLLLPFGLEVRGFSVRRCRHRIIRRVGGRNSLATALGVVGSPFFFVRDFLATRVVIVQGFELNRRTQTNFVPLLES